MTRPNSKKKTGRRLSNILVPAVLIFIAALVWRFQAAGLFNLFTHYPQTLRGGFTRCEKIYSKAIGAEDAAVLSHDPPLVFLSAAPHKSMMGPRVEPGGIYLLDVSSRTVTRIELVGINSSIHPHGISVYHDKESGHVYLFVVNHQDQGSPDQVLIFEYDQQKNELVFKEKVEDEKLISVNDVAGVGPREFYATNDNGYPRGTLNNLLSVLVPWLAKASVVHWNGQQTSWAAQPGSFIMANGIAKSTCNSKIYVADTTNSGSLRIFNRWDDGALQEIQSLALKTGIDNIDVSPDGTIWIGAHPNLLRFITHAALNWSGPSQAISVVLHDTTPVVTEVYLSNGDAENDISASSTALKVANYLLITPVFDDHILLCS